MLCYLLALLSKSIAITLPFILVVYDYWFLRDGARWTWIRRIVRFHLPYIAITLFYGVMMGRFAGEGISRPVRGFDAQIFTQIKGYVYYLKLLLLPVGLNVEHEFTVSRSFFEPAVLLSALILASVVVLAFRMGRRQKLVRFSALWFFITLAPPSLIPLNVLVNEHRLYLPMVGFCFLAAWVLSRRRLGFSKHVLMSGNNLVFLMILLVCGGSVMDRNGVWKDEETLWRDAKRKSPHMPRPHIHLGDICRESGQFDQAEAEYKAALSTDTERYVLTGNDLTVAHNNLGNVYLTRGQFDRAIGEFVQALRVNPDYEKAKRNLKKAYELKRAMGGPVARMHAELGDRYRSRGNMDGAISAYRRALDADPGFGEVYYKLGALYESAERIREALEVYRAFLEWGGNLGQTREVKERIEILKKRLATHAGNP